MEPAGRRGRPGRGPVSRREARMRVITGAGEFTRPDEPGGAHWAEQLRVADLSVGTYSIPADGADEQEPHTEDEVYVVTAGRASFEPAGEPHRFTGVTADLAVIVMFAPAEGSRA